MEIHSLKLSTEITSDVTNNTIQPNDDNFIQLLASRLTFAVALIGEQLVVKSSLGKQNSLFLRLDSL